MLAVAAVIGREFRLATLERVTGNRAAETAGPAGGGSSRRGMIREAETAGQYRFSQELVQETLYEELSIARRRRLHGQVGEAIEPLHAANLAAYLRGVGALLRWPGLVGDSDKAIDYAVKAAERAMAQLAWEGGDGHYRQALQSFDLSGPTGRAATV